MKLPPSFATPAQCSQESDARRLALRGVLQMSLAAALTAGCADVPVAAPPASGGNVSPASLHAAVEWTDRITWGADSAAVALFRTEGREHFLETQLHPGTSTLPADIAAHIAAMPVSDTSMQQLVWDAERQRKAMDSITDDEQKKAAQQAYQKMLNGVANAAAERSLLRDLYSSNQLQEQMTWFWLNHFSVFQGKNSCG